MHFRAWLIDKFSKKKRRRCGTFFLNSTVGLKNRWYDIKSKGDVMLCISRSRRQVRPPKGSCIPPLTCGWTSHFFWGTSHVRGDIFTQCMIGFLLSPTTEPFTKHMLNTNQHKKWNKTFQPSLTVRACKFVSQLHLHYSFQLTTNGIWHHVLCKKCFFSFKYKLDDNFIRKVQRRAHTTKREYVHQHPYKKT